MIKNTIIVDSPSVVDIKRAGEIIASGRLVVFPTETVYGLGANALDPAAANKIYAAKGRPSDNPLIVHLTEPAEAEKYAYTSELFYRLAERFMPGPLTVIMPKKDIVPNEVTGGLDTVALRVPSHPVARALIESANLPIAAPSANISGYPSPTAPSHAIRDMAGRVDMILCGGECEIGLESTVVTLAGGGMNILRPGGITFEMLREIHPECTVDPSVTEKFEGKPASPGMKYKHYSPRADVVILDGDYEKAVEMIKTSLPCGVLCFDEDKELLSLPSSLSMGSADDIERQAHTLFSQLREFDDMGIEKVYARMPRKNGLGLALYNRLIRAAGFEIIKL